MDMSDFCVLNRCIKHFAALKKIDVCLNINLDTKKKVKAYQATIASYKLRKHIDSFMTAGTIDQKAAKTNVAKWEALVLDTAQFYDRAERLLNSKSNRSPRKKFSNTERNRPTRRNGYTKKNSYANSSSGATRTTYRGTQQKWPRRCHVCNSLGHLKKDCPKLLRSSPSSKPRNNFLNNKLKKS